MMSMLLECSVRMKKGLTSKRPLSLRARGVQLLSQREHSVSELRKKLERHVRLLAAFDAACVQAGAHRNPPDHGDQRIVKADEEGWGSALEDAASEGSPSEDLALERGATAGYGRRGVHADDVSDAVSDVLTWLQEKGYLSDARFMQSRVEVRSARFGNVRIRQELALHDIELNSEAEKLLQSSELERAIAILQRKFPQATGAVEVARQARFLRQRGFSFDVVRQALKSSADAELAEG